MGEKGMESPAPVRSGVAGAAELMAPIAGLGNVGGALGGGNMAGALGGGNMAGSMQQGAGGGLGEALGTPNEQAGDAIGQPPKG